MSFRQYPYKLYRLENTGGGFDENGMPKPSIQKWVFHSICRDIPAGSGNIITTENGEQAKYGYKVVMPKGTAEILANTQVKVEDEDGNIRLKAKVIRFALKQLHSRLWV